MNEIIVRTAGPAVVIVIEDEAPTRLVTTAGEADEARLESWIERSPLRETAIAAALADRALQGGGVRQRRWARELGTDPGGVVDVIERALSAKR